MELGLPGQLDYFFFFFLITSFYPLFSWFSVHVHAILYLRSIRFSNHSSFTSLVQNSFINGMVL